MLRTMKTLHAQEIQTKNKLDKFLRQCVQDVKNEIYRKKQENKTSYIVLGKKGRKDLEEESTLTKLEREKIIEVLLS